MRVCTPVSRRSRSFASVSCATSASRGFFVRIEQQRERMSLGGNAAHGVIRPVRRLDRQENAAVRPLSLSVSRTAAVFLSGAPQNVRYTRAGLRAGFSSTFGMGVSSGFAAVPPFDEAPFEDEPFEDGMPFVAVDRVFDRTGFCGGKRRVARRRAVGHAQHGLPPRPRASNSSDRTCRSTA